MIASLNLQFGDRLDHFWEFSPEVLFVTRKQPRLIAALERDGPKAIELDLVEPVAAKEATQREGPSSARQMPATARKGWTFSPKNAISSPVPISKPDRPLPAPSCSCPRERRYHQAFLRQAACPLRRGSATIVSRHASAPDTTRLGASCRSGESAVFRPSSSFAGAFASGSNVPQSQTMTVPPPYSPFGIVPSKSR